MTLSTDERIIKRAIKRHNDRRIIDNLEAKVIASAWHIGQSSALYSFASTGAIDTERVFGELDKCERHPHEGELDALRSYFLQYGQRGPQGDWDGLIW